MCNFALLDVEIMRRRPEFFFSFLFIEFYGVFRHLPVLYKKVDSYSDNFEAQALVFISRPENYSHVCLSVLIIK